MPRRHQLPNKLHQLVHVLLLRAPVDQPAIRVVVNRVVLAGVLLRAEVVAFRVFDKRLAGSAVVMTQLARLVEKAAA